MMPTTRYGRYLLYRSRHMARRKKLPFRRASASLQRNHITSRPFIDEPLGKQAEKSYPRYVYASLNTFILFTNVGDVKPAPGVWGVKVDPNPEFNGLGNPRHFRWARVGYQHRRVRLTGPLKDAPHKGYALPLLLLQPHHVYPFPFYPSGQESYASKQGWI